MVLGWAAGHDDSSRWGAIAELTDRSRDLLTAEASADLVEPVEGDGQPAARQEPVEVASSQFGYPESCGSIGERLHQAGGRRLFVIGQSGGELGQAQVDRHPPVEPGGEGRQTFEGHRLAAPGRAEQHDPRTDCGESFEVELGAVHLVTGAGVGVGEPEGVPAGPLDGEPRTVEAER